jgi:hypothetical protein
MKKLNILKLIFNKAAKKRFDSFVNKYKNPKE